MTTLAPRTDTGTGTVPRRPSPLAALAALAAVLCAAGPAEAQWGFGGFGGWGMGGFLHPYTPPSVSMLDQRANVRAGMDQEALNTTRLAIPDRFAYRDQQVAMQQRFDVESMRGIDVDRRRRGTPIPGSRASPGDVAGAEGGVDPRASAPGVARPMLSIASFVGPEDRVVWPADSPVSGDLAERRDRADSAIEGVVREYQAMDFARVDTVAGARQALLDYGQPALQFIRENSTARVADTFHLFLLSLYDALAQAAERGAFAQASPPPAPR